MDVRDVWPGVALESGVGNRIVFSPLRLLEKILYRRSALITTISEGMVDLLVEENRLDKGKVKAVYNGFDLQRFPALKSPAKVRGEKFSAIYSGTIGTQQRLDTLLEAAKILKENKKISFIICGEGVEKDDLLRRIKIQKLNNIKFLGLLPYSESLAEVKKSDLGLVLLTRNKYNDPALPSKAFDYCFSGTPVLASAGSFLKEFIDREGIGFWVEPENPRKLAEKISEISELPKERLDRMGERGRALVQKIYNRENQARKLERMLEKLISRGNIKRYA